MCLIKSRKHGIDRAAKKKDECRGETASLSFSKAQKYACQCHLSCIIHTVGVVPFIPYIEITVEKNICLRIEGLTNRFNVFFFFGNKSRTKNNKIVIKKKTGEMLQCVFRRTL